MGVDRDARREASFPAIERKYGQPMSYWHGIMRRFKGTTYAEQMSHLIDEHGFSRAHANALVMFTRGSTSSRRFASPDEYFASLDETKAATMRKIFAVIQKRFPDLELVIAWNQPMLKLGKSYVFGASAAKEHLLLAPWNTEVLQSMSHRLEGLEVNKKTIRVPVDWKVDTKLLNDLVAAAI